MEIFSQIETILNDLRQMYEQYGYSRFKMSKFEEYDFYMEYRDFLSSSGIITFTDLSGRLYALKPDITLSIAKSVRENETKKVYYTENVYRPSHATGEYREITQLGLEYIGSVDSYTAGEVLLLAAKSLEAIEKEYVIDVSDMQVIRGIADCAGLDSLEREKMLGFLGKKQRHEIIAYCAELHLEKKYADAFVALCDYSGGFGGVIDRISELAFSPEIECALDKLKNLYNFLDSAGYGDKINLDFSIVNDLGYYNGIIFKGYVKGVPSEVLTGGRYDRLMEKLGRSCQAIGFAIFTDCLDVFDENNRSFDVDTLIIYGDEANPEDVEKEVSSRVSKGERVRASREIPRGIKYNNLVKIGEKEGCLNG